MSKALDQFSRNLAGGMSRRKALWAFITSLVGVAALTGSKAYAGTASHCDDFCRVQADLFRELCMEASRMCPNQSCAEISLIRLNGATPTSFNGGPFVCVPVS